MTWALSVLDGTLVRCVRADRTRALNDILLCRKDEVEKDSFFNDLIDVDSICLPAAVFFN